MDQQEISTLASTVNATEDFLRDSLAKATLRVAQLEEHIQKVTQRSYADSAERNRMVESMHEWTLGELESEDISESQAESIAEIMGFELTKEDLKNFRQFDSKTPGHPEFDLSTGIDMTTGPLGQGFSTGVGFAVAERYLSELLGEDIIDHFTYGIVSDGDLMEGISFEAAELAAVWKLGKLIYVFDNNNISIDGRVSKVSITDQKKKFEAGMSQI